MLNCGDEDSVAAAALPDGLTADAEETIAETEEEETSTKSEQEASKRTRGAAGSTQ